MTYPMHRVSGVAILVSAHIHLQSHDDVCASQSCKSQSSRLSPKYHFWLFGLHLGPSVDLSTTFGIVRPKFFWLNNILGVGCVYSEKRVSFS